jgi:hypothetical protein
MHTAIGEAISRGGPLTIDMSDVSFVDPPGVGAILNYVEARPSGCIILHGVHSGVGKLMNIMGVEHPPKLHVIPCTLLVLGVTAPDVSPGESGLAGDVRHGHCFEETFRRCNGVPGIESIASHGSHHSHVHTTSYLPFRISTGRTPALVFFTPSGPRFKTCRAHQLRVPDQIRWIRPSSKTARVGSRSSGWPI